MKLANFFLSIIIITSINIESEGTIPAKHFACFSNNFDLEMSPNGKYLSIITSPMANECNIEEDLRKYVEDDFRKGKLAIMNLETGSTRTLFDGKDGGVSGLTWLSNERIMFNSNPSRAAGIKSYGLRAMNLDGSKKKTLMEYVSNSGKRINFSVVSLLPDDENNIAIKVNDRRESVYDYYKLNINSGKKVRIANGPDIENEAWVADSVESPDGMPVTVTTNYKDEWRIYAYDDKSKEWSIHFKNTCQTPTFFPLSSYEDKWLVAGQDINKSKTFNAENDKSKLFLYDPQAKSFELLYEDPEYDVAGPVGGCRTADGSASIDPKTNELTSVSYYADKPVRLWFDDELETLYSDLQGAFPNDNVTMVTSDINKNKAVFQVSSPTEPGAYYLYDKKAGMLSYLWDRSPWIDRTKLATNTPIKFTARDGMVMNGYLTTPINSSGKNLPMVVHPHGGPNARDYWRYDPYVQHLASLGYAVLQINFRGSTGYGAKHYISANKQFGLTMQDDITDGVEWAISKGIANKDNIAIYGGSYGGYATMAGLAFTPNLYAAGINYVGVVDLELLQEGSNRSSRRFNGFYDELRLEWGDPDIPEDMEYIRKTSPLRHAGNIKAPVLIAHGAQDPNVLLVHARKLANELDKNNKEYEWYVEPYEGHGFSGEQSRLNLFNRVEDFLGKHLDN